MKITVVFKSDYQEVIHTTVANNLTVKDIDNLVRESYSGVSYWAVGVNN